MNSSDTLTNSVPAMQYGARLANAIELKWQRFWRTNQTFRTLNPGEPGFDAAKPKRFILDMFPFPSGAGLHVGHPRGYIATDVYARYLRMRGFNVLHTMGFDAFGLPAEQYAIETGTHPRVTTERNIAAILAQLDRLGLAHDPDRRVSTTDIGYMKWTQWIFLKLYNSWFDEQVKRARPIEELIAEFESGKRSLSKERLGETSEWPLLDPLKRKHLVDSYRLAYRDNIIVNWCPALGTVLANEEVTADGKSERGNHQVYRRPLKQWVLRITAFADRLEQDLQNLDWPTAIKTMQSEWIGRSEGAEVNFHFESNEFPALQVYTTRPDTIWGATYLVVAPEHPLVAAVVKNPTSATDVNQLNSYITAARRQSDVQRLAGTKTKTGVHLGIFAINPATGGRIAVWTSDYVLMGYGTGAIMAVPAHDQRDMDFAQTFGLPIVDVVYPREIMAAEYFVRHVFPDRKSPDELKAFIGLVLELEAEPSHFDAIWDRAELPSNESQENAENVVNELKEAGIGSLVDLREVFSSASLYSRLGKPFCGEGFSVNSGPITGLGSNFARTRITEWLEEQRAGRKATRYKLRDWIFSRQRYWGEPFPLVYDDEGEPYPLPESFLPIVLPELDDFSPEATGDFAAPPRPPLARARDWMELTEDIGFGLKHFRRESNTMPQWAGSCWYYLRYLDPTNSQAFCAPDVEKYWMGGILRDSKSSESHFGGVDLYVGGVEHAVLHLLYARFWHKALYDLGYVSTPEPFQGLFNQGYVLAAAFKNTRGTYVPAKEVEERDGKYYYHDEPVEREWGKMGKSLKNGVSPDEIFTQYGCDTLRLYEMSMGPLDASQAWNPRDIIGSSRFLARVWRLIVDEQTGEPRVSAEPLSDSVERFMARTIEGVRNDMERLSFNTAIAKLHEFTNALSKLSSVSREAAKVLILAISPFAPHFAEELWEKLGNKSSLAYEPFPIPNAEMLREALIELPVAICAKVRSVITVPSHATQAEVEKLAHEDEKIAWALQSKTIVKVIYVPGRMLNLIVR